MSHLVRVLTDAKIKRGLILTGQNLADIDENTLKSINGDGGGTYSPGAAVEIAGEGVVVAGPWTMSGAGVTATTAADKPITFAKGDAGDYFGYDVAHPGASPSVFVDFATIDGAAFNAQWNGGFIPRVAGGRALMSLPVYSSAPQVDAVVVTFSVHQFHGAVPQVLPQMRVIAVASDGTVTPLRAPDPTTDTNGFQFVPTPANGTVWTNGGVPQTWTYTCNVALPVDSGTYLYFVEIIDESGANSWTSSPNQYQYATVAHSLVTIFDGRN